MGFRYSQLYGICEEGQSSNKKQDNSSSREIYYRSSENMEERLISKQGS